MPIQLKRAGITESSTVCPLGSTIAPLTYWRTSSRFSSRLTNGTSSAISSTVNAQNELVTDGTANLTFDNDGNTTTDDQGHTLVWDAWNRLVDVTSGSVTLSSYVYDGAGRLITTAVGTVNTDTYFSGAQDIENRAGVSSGSNHIYCRNTSWEPTQE